ncbi:MAG TPA: DNA polymerase IV [Acidimicrobiales bacterium]|nr:DNA polymerase IV [Acidimicrobiales bacterium]
MQPQEEDALDLLHLDMDCFFAAVEMVDDPELKGRPVIVGGTSRRGVVASASYEARAYGVHAAMPTAEAMRCCPDGVFRSPSHARYGEMNRRLLEIIERVTPEFEPIAFDEAFIDVSGAHGLFGASAEIAWKLWTTVQGELGLTCSVGVARTKLIAKLASKAAKPSVSLSNSVPRRPVVREGLGVCVIPREDEIAFLYAHSLRALPGIGPKTMAKLQAVGISSIADAAEVGRQRLRRLLGERQGEVIVNFIEGIDPRRVESSRDTRSIGAETTFSRDLYDPNELASRTRELSSSVAARSRQTGAPGRTVSLKIRYRDLEIITHSRTFDRPFRSGAEIADVAVALLDSIACDRGIRLLGVHLSNFVDQDSGATKQLALFGGETEADEESQAELRGNLDATTDEIRRRFGDRALDPLSVLGRRMSRGEENKRRPIP